MFNRNPNNPAAIRNPASETQYGLRRVGATNNTIGSTVPSTTCQPQNTHQQSPLITSFSPSIWPGIPPRNAMRNSDN